MALANSSLKNSLLSILSRLNFKRKANTPNFFLRLTCDIPVYETEITDITHEEQFKNMIEFKLKEAENQLTLFINSLKRKLNE